MTFGLAGGKSPTTPVSKRKQNAHLPAPAALTKSRSHESQLSVRPDASDVRYVSTLILILDYHFIQIYFDFYCKLLLATIQYYNFYYCIFKNLYIVY